MKRINFWALLLGLTFGLSGCVVYDDEPGYVYHSYGSYESAIDYYHRPPRPYISQHHKYQTVHSKPKHIDDHHHHAKKPEPIKKHLDDHHHAKKAEPVKKHEPVRKDDHFKKSQPPVNDKIHDKKMPEHHDIKKDMGKRAEVNKPKQPTKDIIHDKKTMGNHNFKNSNVQNMKPKHMGKHR